MGKGAFFISKIPLPLTSISLGRFITVPKNPPQTFFDPQEKLPAKPSPASDHSDILNPSEFIERSYGTNLELVLANFASVFFNVESTNARRLAACRMTRYFILDADSWFDMVCAEKLTQFWLERQTMRKKNIYLVTEYCTLVQHSSSEDTKLATSVGGSVQPPLAAAIGLPVPTPLDPSATARIDASNSRQVSYNIPGEKVFWIGYQQVKLSKNVEGNLEYVLSDKRKWQALCSVRDASVEKASIITAELGNISIPEDCETLETEDEIYFFDKEVEQPGVQGQGGKVEDVVAH